MKQIVLTPKNSVVKIIFDGLNYHFKIYKICLVLNEENWLNRLLQLNPILELSVSRKDSSNVTNSILIAGLVSPFQINPIFEFSNFEIFEVNAVLTISIKINSGIRDEDMKVIIYYEHRPFQIRV